MTITMMLLLSNTSLVASELRLPRMDRELPSGSVGGRLIGAPAARRYDKPEIEVRRVEEERPYAL
jgi:hypothetical protein